jgi:glycosyltransferase involved in cell wall biosynthesis
MRIVIVQAGLGAGGAEKIVNMLAHHRLRCGDEVDVIAVNAASAQSFFPYDDAIAIHALGGNIGGGLDGHLVRLRRLRQRLQALQPQLVISFLTKINVMVGIATMGLGTSTIMSERNNFRAQKMHPAWRFLARVFAGRAANLVMQTELACASLPDRLKNLAVVIPNPVTLTPFKRPTQGEHFRFVAVGRLERQKGFDLLLEAFARAADKLPSASLAIFGEGPERPALKLLADRLGISGRIVMPGTTKTPQEWLEAGSIFVLSSRFEGFPNVLLEALLTGMATVAFDCPWGPSEIFRNEESYPLVPAADVDALAAALIRVATDPETKRRLEDIGPRVAARFSETSVFAQWDGLIDRTITH